MASKMAAWNFHNHQISKYYIKSKYFGHEKHEYDILLMIWIYFDPLTIYDFFHFFVIRITFLTNREVPRRIRERDLVQATPISVMFKSNSTQSKYLIKSLHHLKWQLLVCRKIVWPNMYIIIYLILIFLHTSLPEL